MLIQQGLRLCNIDVIASATTALGPGPENLEDLNKQ